MKNNAQRDFLRGKIGQKVELRGVVDLHCRADDPFLVANTRNCRKSALHVKLFGTHAKPVVPAGGREVDHWDIPHQVVATTVEEQTEIGELGASVKELRVEGLGESTERRHGSGYALSLNKETQRREGSLSRRSDVWLMKLRIDGEMRRSSSRTRRWLWLYSSNTL